MCLANDGDCRADPGAWAEAERSLNMRDRNVRLTGLQF